MLFRRKIVPSCAYCKHGMTLGLGEVACCKRGIMTDEGKCMSFHYEPTKRRPEYAKSPPAAKIAAEDMSL